MTATLNHFKVSFLVTHIFNRNKLPFNFKFINYRFHPHVFSFDLKVVTISRKPCYRPYSMIHAAWIHGPSWCRPEMDRFWVKLLFFLNFQRKSLQMITVTKKSNCIFDRRCNFFEKIVTSEKFQNFLWPLVVQM